MLPELYYISQGSVPAEHLHNIRMVLEAGIKMIQLRIKEISDEEYLAWAVECVGLCRKYHALCIINDNPQVALYSGADGVHVGKEDTPPQQIRTMFGKKTFILGITAHSLEEFLQAVSYKPGYIGLGPYAVSSTKIQNIKALGLYGIKEIWQHCSPEVPVYAIGGITRSDVPGLLQAGCHGVAVSADLTGDPQNVFLKVKEYERCFKRHASHS